MFPANVFPENEPLIRTLADLGDLSTDRAQQRLMSALLGSRLMVPTNNQTLEQVEDGILRAGARVGFITLSAEHSAHDFVPAFTDEGALRHVVPDDVPYIALAFLELAGIIAGGRNPNGLVINPNSDEALPLSPGNVASIATDFGGPRVDMFEADADAVVGAPSTPLPLDVQEEIVAQCERSGVIDRCWQLEWFIPERHNEPTRVLCVQLDPAIIDPRDQDEVLDRFWASLQPMLQRAGLPVEMTSGPESFGSLVEDEPPIYQRAA